MDLTDEARDWYRKIGVVVIVATPRFSGESAICLIVVAVVTTQGVGLTPTLK